MADGAAVLAGIARAPGRDLRGADAEPQGLRGGAGGRRERGGDLRLGLRDASAGATSTASIAESLERFAPVAEAARARRRAAARLRLLRHRLPVRGADRPASGIARVAAAAVRARLPRGQPRRHHRPRHAGDGGARCCDAVLEVAPPERLPAHFHDTRGRALENIAVALGLRPAGRSTPPAAGSAAVRTRRAPRAMSPPSGWRRCSRRSASRPASTRPAGRGGGLRARPARRRMSGAAAFHRRRDFGSSCGDAPMSSLFIHRKFSYGEHGNKNKTGEEAACRIGPSSSSRPMRGSTSV